MNSIDAVISWVDGTDPIFQSKLKLFCQNHGFNQNQVLEPTRIQQVNEIDYCLKSVLRFAPWIRYIFLITNEQVPAIINALNTSYGNKIKIINQNDLLQKFNTKTEVFNSLSIEWLMWHIPDLSQQFIYLNDDCFIIRPVNPEDFFRKQKIVIRGDWKTATKYKWFPKFKREPNLHRSWQEDAAELAGSTRQFFFLDHAPYSLNKNTFNNFSENKKLLSENAFYPFRDAKQISSVPLIVHLDIKAKNIIHDKKRKAIMVNGATHKFKKIKSRLAKVQKDPKITFVCMQSIDQAPLPTQQYLLNWLQENIG